MHHGIGHPFRAVAAFIIGPLAFGIEIRLLVWWKALDLTFVQADLEVVVMLCRGAQAFRGNDELLGRKPASSIDDDVVDDSGGMVEDNVIDLAQLFVVQAIEMRAANILSSVRNARAF